MIREPKSTHLRETRDEDLYKSYCKALEEHSFNCDTDACNWVRTHGAPRFYVTPDFCAILMSRLLRGVDCGLKGLRMQRALDMFDIFLNVCNEKRFIGRPMVEICNYVVECPAPQFYLERRSVATIVAKERIRHRNDLVERWVR